MGNLLEKIFTGEPIVTFEAYKDTRDYREAVRIRNAATDRIEEELPGKLSLLDDWMYAVSDIHEMAEREAFRKGFSLAARLFVEALSENP